MTKFTIALREIGTYKEVLRSQVTFQYLLFFYVIAAIFLLMLYFSTPYLGQKAASVAFQEMTSKHLFNITLFCGVCFRIIALTSYFSP